MIPITATTALAIFVITVITTILICCLVLPRKKDGNFKGGFGQFLHDLFHFKHFFIEDILRFFYILATVFFVFYGFVGMIGYQEYWGGYRESTFISGLITMVVAPIALRLIFEMLMMVFSLVRNVSEINRKLGKKTDCCCGHDHHDAPEAPEAPNADPGTWTCSNCGRTVPDTYAFCDQCGHKH